MSGRQIMDFRPVVSSRHWTISPGVSRVFAWFRLCLGNNPGILFNFPPKTVLRVI